MNDNFKEAAKKSNNWVFDQARKIMKRLNNKLPEKGYVLFQTGYGPSGLPHIGTFGENARTSMVMHAFKELSGMPTKLIAFSDDLDALRKVPTNIPNQELISGYIGKPLTQVPDPFEEYNSFGEHNNARLKSFLDSFGFEYELYSSTECYSKGLFDPIKSEILAHHEEICDIIRPTLGKERRATYSPFLPIDKKSGNVLQAKIISYDTEQNTIIYLNEEKDEVETSIFGTNCKLQWKVDWAMRWMALDVDYEMCGKDLIDSVNLASKILKLFKKRPPQNLIYELFLDSKGEKISKSKGNGISIEDWLKYGTPEALSLFMYQKPQTAKRLHFDIIPQSTDEYFKHIKSYMQQDVNTRLNNPAYHILGRKLENTQSVPVSYSLLLNLASVVNAENKDILWSFIKRYSPEASPQNNRELDKLCNYAVNYYQDFIKPNKQYITISDNLRPIFNKLIEELKEYENNTPSNQELQNIIYKVGKENGFADNLREWFKLLYQALLGQEKGPRFGGFIEIYGIDKTIQLIESALNNKLSS